jgi:hypothetical protein
MPLSFLRMEILRKIVGQPPWPERGPASHQRLMKTAVADCEEAGYQPAAGCQPAHKFAALLCAESAPQAV